MLSCVNDIIWIIDSGSTNHMTSIKNLLFHTITLHISYIVSFPNDYKVKVSNIGSLALFYDLIVHNFFYLPNFKHKLIYVHMILSYYDDVVQFFKYDCSF